MFEDYTQVNYITEVNINYFMRDNFNTDLIFKYIEQYEQAIKLGFDKDVWEKKNEHIVYVRDDSSLGLSRADKPTDEEKEELIAWWNRFLNY